MDESAIRIMEQMHFDIGGKIVKADIASNLVPLIYEDDTFRRQVIAQIREESGGMCSGMSSNKCSNAPHEYNMEEYCDNNDTQFKWTPEMTRLLLETYHTEKDNFRNPKMKKSLLWTKISNMMAKHGHTVSRDVCDRKFRNLKSTYREVKDKVKKTGRGRQAWDYLEIMDDIFSTDATVNPQHLISSLPPTSSVEALSAVSNCEVVSGNTPPLASPSSSNGSTQVWDNTRRREQKNRGLEEFRRKYLELQEKQTRELSKMREALQTNVQVQQERNLILQELVSLLKKTDENNSDNTV